MLYPSPHCPPVPFGRFGAEAVYVVAASDILGSQQSPAPKIAAELNANRVLFIKPSEMFSLDLLRPGKTPEPASTIRCMHPKPPRAPYHGYLRTNSSILRQMTGNQ